MLNATKPNYGKEIENSNFIFDATSVDYFLDWLVPSIYRFIQKGKTEKETDL